MTAHRTLVCTLTAIASGLFGAYAGNQLSAIASARSCRSQLLGLNTLCQIRPTTTTIWGGSFTGFWVGAMLGAFGAGLATHQAARNQTTATLISHNPEAPDPAWRSPETLTTPPALELTALQTEVLYCLMVLLAAQSDQPDMGEVPSSQAKNTAHYLPQFRAWAEAIAQSQSPSCDVTKLPDVQQLTVSETRQLLLAAGFSTQAVDQAWQIFPAVGLTSST